MGSGEGGEGFKGTRWPCAAMCKSHCLWRASERESQQKGDGNNEGRAEIVFQLGHGIALRC